MKKKTSRILAITGIAILAGMYVCALIFSFVKSEFAHTMFLVSIACTFIIPVFLYAMLLVAKVVRPSKSPVIDSVIFDIGAVLIDVHKEDHIRKMNVSKDAEQYLMDEMGCGRIWREYDKGLESEEEIIKLYLKEKPQYEKEIREYCLTISEDMPKFPYADSWLSSLKAAGYKVYILSDWPKEIMERCKALGNMSFLSICDDYVFSHQCHYNKPDSHIFEALIKKTGLNPKRSIMLDDRENIIKAAKDLGFSGIVFKDYQDAVQKLKTLGVHSYGI